MAAEGGRTNISGMSEEEKGGIFNYSHAEGTDLFWNYPFLKKTTLWSVLLWIGFVPNKYGLFKKVKRIRNRIRGKGEECRGNKLWRDERFVLPTQLGIRHPHTILLIISSQSHSLSHPIPTGKTHSLCGVFILHDSLALKDFIFEYQFELK